ncbi:hypothetical protein P152DRAFT_387732 [Eremomyces bilateralis CBS 781.70]|uniref:C2H2-type domain-containing protein n=1 Tax=Eremomyces bilateralis CBS 781.70 TaxID=1392243 RepID=A0A6G1GIB0_9PEZI|nr:uncharacterized protein P152DRAFT_387732 [Eremomyces bilateralis CBS 781.70]KAF1817600.1 hypothetical protein P152DRAFT_387732 [Eremomyces bilateralis CBS 781.70]
MTSEASTTKKLQCNECSKSTDRQCDMNKHKKRHRRPYGCTFPRCSKTFGSKSDWKRHENSQHFQSELWRCQQPARGRLPEFCARPFFHKEEYLTHLVKEHDRSASKVEEEVEKCRIGRNGQVRFWCGFCRTILSAEGTGAEAWEMRFTHIDEHINKEGKRVDSWLCVEENKLKGERKEEKTTILRENEEVGKKRGRENESPVEMPPRPPKTPRREMRTASTTAIAPSALYSLRMERAAGDSAHICCCGSGPYLKKVYSACLACGREFCSNCSSEELACHE